MDILSRVCGEEGDREWEKNIRRRGKGVGGYLALLHCPSLLEYCTCHTLPFLTWLAQPPAYRTSPSYSSSSTNDKGEGKKGGETRQRFSN